MVRRPFREAGLLTILVLGVAFLRVLIVPRDFKDFWSAAHERAFYLPLGCTVLAIGSIALAYALLGSRIGTRRASTTIKVLIVAILLPVLVVLAVLALVRI
jgi:hypothetical protein